MSSITLSGDGGCGSVEILHIKIIDGNNTNSEEGCFFVLLAEKGVDIDPSKYSFYVSKLQYSPNKLDLNEYRNNTVTNYTADGNNIWNEGEIIGFNMPKEDIDIEINDGMQYDVLIKNSKSENVFRNDFKYYAWRLIYINNA